MKLKNIACVLPVSVVALSACAMDTYQSGIQSGKLVEAKPQSQQIHVVKEYVPVPVPGQLRPIPNKLPPGSVSKAVASKEEAVKSANLTAIQYPSGNDFFNAMMTYNYMPGALYTIYTAPLTITDIVFQPGESIISQAAGDTLRWQIASTYSGSDKNLKWHILIKPQKTSLTNSMIITTNKRTYHLVLKSVEPGRAMVSVKWNYSHDMVQGFDSTDLGTMNADQTGTPIPPPPKQTSGDLNIDLSQMTFNYTWRMLKGDTPTWYPQQIFSVGHQTYIKFPHDVVISNATMPVPFIESSGSDNYGTSNFNWRMQGDYMVIDTVIKKAYLKVGTKKSGETIVEITSKNT